MSNVTTRSPDNTSPVATVPVTVETTIRLTIAGKTHKLDVTAVLDGGQIGIGDVLFWTQMQHTQLLKKLIGFGNMAAVIHNVPAES